MGKILGLDLGPASVGHAIVERFYDAVNELESFEPLINGSGVLVFGEGYDKDSSGNDQSRAANRRNKRGPRRLTYRRKLRKYRTLKVLAEQDWCPLDIEELNQWRKSRNLAENKPKYLYFKRFPENEVFQDWLATDNIGNKEKRSSRKKNPYYFRHLASTEKLDLTSKENRYILGRAFYHIAQRRGFLSNRLDKAESELEEFVTKCFIVFDEDGEDKFELKSRFQEIFVDFLKELKRKDKKEWTKDEKAIEKLYRNLNEIIDSNEEQNRERCLLRYVKAISKRLDLSEDDKKQWLAKTQEIFETELSENWQNTLHQRQNSANVEAEDFYRKQINETFSYSEQVLFKNEIEYRLKTGLGDVAEGIMDLTAKIKAENCDTLGQYFWKLYQGDRHDSENKIRGKYTAREDHYLNEFDQICRVQDIDSINTEYSIKQPAKRYSGLVLTLYKAIFFQRPLKSQKGLVGNCRFEKSKPRCPVSHPLFEEMRALEVINKIKYKNEEGNFQQLSEDDKKHIWHLFFRKSKRTFEFNDIAKSLNKKYGMELEFNYRKENYKTAFATATLTAGLMDVFGKDWEQKGYTERTWQDILENPIWKDNLFKAYAGDKFKWERKYTDREKNIYERTDKEIGQKTKEEVVTEIWHAIFSFTKPDKLKVFAKEKLQISDEKQQKAFANINAKRDYASLSLCAILKIVPFLREGLVQSHAVFMGKIPDLLSDEIWLIHKDEIKSAFEEIIGNYNTEKKELNILNGIIKNGNGNAPEKEHIFKNELKNALEDENRFNDLFRILLKQLKKNEGRGEFIPMPRLDEKIAEWLLLHDALGVDDQAVKKIYHPSDLNEFKTDILRDKEGKPLLRNGKEIPCLGSPAHPAINNPVVMRTLHQLKRVINHLIEEDKIDQKTVVHLEMAGEVNDKNMRAAIKKYQDSRKEENEQFREIITELYRVEYNKNNYKPEEEDVKKIRSWTTQFNDCGESLFKLIMNKDGKKFLDDAVKKYRLWREQEGKCVYTGTSIPLYKLFDGNLFDIEHTIPRSTSYDNSLENLTICDSTYNRKEKSGKAPFQLGAEKHQAILNRIEHWKNKYKNYKEILDNVNIPENDEEKRNQAIVKKNLNRLYYEYWKGKYDRFAMEEVKNGFINKNLVDTRIIAKYARAYLQSYFNKKVHCVNGQMTAQFRSAWGVQKSRDNHVHHAKDAITIACMTKHKYDRFAEAWRKAEAGNKKAERELLEATKPWEGFSEHVNNLDNFILVNHFSKDNVGKQTKKKLRKRSKIDYCYKDELPKNMFNKKEGKDYFIVDRKGKKMYKLPIYQQGDTVRAALHKDTFYGKIKQPKRDKDGKIIVRNNKIILEQENGSDKFTYVVRKELTKLKESDINNIVDPVVRSIIDKAKNDKYIAFNNNGAVVKKKIWMNQEKGIEIKKVRIKTSLKNPPAIKEQKDTRQKNGRQRHEWKEHYYAEGGGIYLMAVYEGKNRSGKTDRAYDFVDYLDAGKYYGHNNSEYRAEYDIAPEKHDSTGYPLRACVRKGQMVLFYKKAVNEIWNLPQEEKQKRLYKIISFEGDGRINLHFHQIAMQQSSKNKDEMTIQKYMKDNNLKNSEINYENPVPWLRIRKGNFNFAIEGTDFELTASGKIKRKDGVVKSIND